MDSGSSRGCSPAICWTRAKHNVVWIILCEQSRSWPSIFRQILDFHTPGFTAPPICFFTCFSHRVISLQVLHNLRPTKNGECIQQNILGPMHKTMSPLWWPLWPVSSYSAFKLTLTFVKLAELQWTLTDSQVLWFDLQSCDEQSIPTSCFKYLRPVYIFFFNQVPRPTCLWKWVGALGILFL